MGMVVMLVIGRMLMIIVVVLSRLLSVVNLVRFIILVVGWNRLIMNLFGLLLSVRVGIGTSGLSLLLIVLVMIVVIVRMMLNLVFLIMFSSVFLLRVLMLLLFGILIMRIGGVCLRWIDFDYVWLVRHVFMGVFDVTVLCRLRLLALKQNVSLACDSLWNLSNALVMVAKFGVLGSLVY